MTSKEIKEQKQKRIEDYLKNNDAVRPAEASRIFPSFSIDYFYDHWQEFGGKISKEGRKSIYYPIPRFKIEKCLGIKEKATVEYFLNLTTEEKEKVVLELLPFIRDNLFKQKA
ncbi:MAG: hypothetical protein ABSG94_12790 [Brevinematales bacterium]|jgi:hypothetical protein